jgi:hypothetical protein
VLGIATPAPADEPEDLHPLLSNVFSMDVGVFFSDRDLDLRVNGSVGIENEEFDFDEVAGRRDDEDIFAVEMAWRFSENWSARAQYFDSSQSTRTTLTQDVTWGDDSFTEGSNVGTGSSIEVTRLFVGRHLDSEAHHDYGLGFGIHWLDIGVFIDGTAIVNGEPVTGRRAVNAEGPLPNLGVWYRRSMSPRWAFRSRLDLFSASVGEYDGLLVNASAGFNYQAFEHFGIGLAYNFFEFDVGVDNSGWRGDVETNFHGLYLSVSALCCSSR